MAQNSEISITETRKLLARSGEDALPLSAYRRYLKTGVLERPAKSPGHHPYHTLEQAEAACERLRAITRQAFQPTVKGARTLVKHCKSFNL